MERKLKCFGERKKQRVITIIGSRAAHAGAIAADLPNYTDIQPTIQMSEVKIYRHIPFLSGYKP